MISGPTVPRTRSGLWNMVSDHTDRLERGLTIVHEDIRTDDGIQVDALACDANGHPVVLFLLLPEDAPDFVRRLMQFDAWFVKHRELLLKCLWLGGMDRSLAHRMFVVGFDINEPMVERLRQTQIAGLEVFQFSTFTVGGALRIGVVPRLCPEAAALDCSFQMPTSLTDPLARTLCSTLMAWIHKLEPAIQVQGDRYSRRFLFEGELLAELVVERNNIRLLVPGGAERATFPRGTLGSIWEISAAFDAAARRYLKILCGEEALSLYEPSGLPAKPVPVIVPAANGGKTQIQAGNRLVSGADRSYSDSSSTDHPPLRAAANEGATR